MGMLIAILLPGGAQAQGKSDLVAHASDDTLWIAQIHPPQSKDAEESTTVRYRSTNTADQTWHELPEFLGRVVQMSHDGQSLVVLMASGEWDLLWPGGDSVGPSLPDHSKMLSIASDRDLLYAVGLPGGEPPATTNSSDLSANSDATTVPTTAESSAATAPTTQPRIATDKPILYDFEDGIWKAIANCPASHATQPGDVSLSIVDRKPMLAQLEPGAVAVYELNDNKEWVLQKKIALPAAPRMFKLLSDTQRPILWADTGEPGGTLYLGGSTWQKPISLTLSSPVQHETDRTVAEAAGNIRLFIADTTGKIFEQRYDSNGQRQGNIATLEAPEPSSPDFMDTWPMMLLMAALAFLMLSSIRRQDSATAAEAQPGASDALVLAPSGQRLLAAMIDAIPLIVAAIYVLDSVANPFDWANLSSTLPPIIIAMVIYLLHTTITELFAGRSLGKMIVGLRVVTTDGGTPGKSAMLLRNLLRLLDVIPIPLGFIVLTTPLRQRVGDMIAKTVVIVMTEPQKEEDGER